MKIWIISVLFAISIMFLNGCFSHESAIPEGRWERNTLPIDGMYVTGVGLESGTAGEVEARQKAYIDALKKIPEAIQEKIKAGEYGLFERDSVIKIAEIDDIWYTGVKVLYKLKRINP